MAPWSYLPQESGDLIKMMHHVADVPTT
ncbi:hypothetical protein CGLO_11823 [Colletotrichum gloeosporioides Cg-14]|uniref:Uncharacterized protein n=1 Tax=Colletotrichum gloeosporioides (strain Cg-14) TaxID=1237896 RepID=T0LAU7_COLGC|nr:hypothetical protein CGLO_11823 [Colletotrichum gloeosporioides Cg-14]